MSGGGCTYSVGVVVGAVEGGNIKGGVGFVGKRGVMRHFIYLFVFWEVKTENSLRKVVER
jgi:hypothetical protein